MKQPKLGDQIKVSAHHWCRAHDVGTIVAELPHGRFEILFDKEGGGYNKGTTLMLDEKDIEIVE
jgi:hypothetical protein